jgi:hypothetical protein
LGGYNLKTEAQDGKVQDTDFTKHAVLIDKLDQETDFLFATV